MAKIGDFVHFEPLWSLNTNFAGHSVCGKVLSIWSSSTCNENCTSNIQTTISDDTSKNESPDNHSYNFNESKHSSAAVRA